MFKNLLAAGTLLFVLAACDKKLSVGPEQGTALYPREVIPTNTPGPATPISDPVDISPPASPIPTPPISPTPVPPMRIFLSSITFDGILDGVAGADSICESLAGSVGYGGTWVAFMSETNSDVVDRISEVGPWLRMDGKLTFDSVNGMTSGFYSESPAMDEWGNLIPTGANFWTGTSFNGVASDIDCGGWSANASISGTIGDANQPFTAFYNSGSMSCAAQARLMCVQQTGVADAG